jgi:hypothetical protein
MIGDVLDAIDAEVAVAARGALHFHFMRDVGRGRLLVDAQVNDLSADIRGEFELIAAGRQAPAQVTAGRARLRCAAHCALVGVLCHRHCGREQERRRQYQYFPHRNFSQG